MKLKPRFYIAAATAAFIHFGVELLLLPLETQYIGGWLLFQNQTDCLICVSDSHMSCLCIRHTHKYFVLQLKCVWEPLFFSWFHFKIIYFQFCFEWRFSQFNLYHFRFLVLVFGGRICWQAVIKPHFPILATLNIGKVKQTKLQTQTEPERSK